MNKTRRSSIVTALADKLKEISHSNGYVTDLGGQVYTSFKYWNDIQEFPCICLTAASEQIVHQAGGYKDRYLDIILRCFVENEDPILTLEGLLEDIEIVIDNTGRLAYLDASGNLATTRDIIITRIDTDQGTLAPLGVGEMTLQVKY